MFWQVSMKFFAKRSRGECIELVFKLGPCRVTLASIYYMKTSSVSYQAMTVRLGSFTIYPHVFIFIYTNEQLVIYNGCLDIFSTEKKFSWMMTENSDIIVGLLRSTVRNNVNEHSPSIFLVVVSNVKIYVSWQVNIRNRNTEIPGGLVRSICE